MGHFSLKMNKGRPLQGGATCHIAEDTLDVLRLVFEDRIITRRADVVWQSKISVTPETIDALKDNVKPLVKYR